MVEFRKQICHLITLGHVAGDLFTASVIVNMSVGIDDLHCLSPLRSAISWQRSARSQFNSRAGSNPARDQKECSPPSENPIYLSAPKEARLIEIYAVSTALCNVFVASGMVVRPISHR